MENTSNWVDCVSSSENGRVLMMLSGGKDSSAALLVLKELDLDVTAVHFTHAWGYEVSTGEARKLCRELSVPLLEVDFTDEFCAAVANYLGGRPCLLCKPQMYRKVIDIVRQKRFGWVCIGDNANDRTTIARLKDHLGNQGEEDHLCSTYFGSERGVMLPEGVKVLRPLLDLTSMQVEGLLRTKGVSVQNNCSTGDKYFEYSREGCPVQFCDPGYPLTEALMDDLKKYNLIISDFARDRKIKASVHLPSTFIVTIPRGMEAAAGSYLEARGLAINWEVNRECREIMTRRVLTIKIHNGKLLDPAIFEILMHRFFERLELRPEFVCQENSADMTRYTYADKDLRVEIAAHPKTNIISYDFMGFPGIEHDTVANLIVEIYRTRQFSVQ